NNGRIQKFNQYGSYIGKWGWKGTAEGQLASYMGLTIDKSGTIYCTDNEHGHIIQFDSTGTLKMISGSTGEGKGLMQNPFGIAVSQFGLIYVADKDNNLIQVFDQDGNYSQQWGVAGSQMGELRFPSGLIIDSNGNIYVADTYNHRVQKYDPGGGVLISWGSDGSGAGQFSYPLGLTMDNAGNIYVADTGNHRIQKFDKNGLFLKQWETKRPADVQPTSPSAIMIDKTGALFVTDTSYQRVQRYSLDGEFITQWGSLGAGEGKFNGPFGIAADANGYIYVADTGNKRIQKFKTVPFYSLKGYIRDVKGEGVAGVVLNLTGAQTGTCPTDNTGYFEFVGIEAGDYVITPVKEGVQFSPSQLTYQGLAISKIDQNFELRHVFSITGNIKNAWGATVNGVKVTLSGAGTGEYITTVNGYYEFKLTENGEYFITPTKLGCSFDPATIRYVANQLVAEEDFTSTWTDPASISSISGYVQNSIGEGLNAATITLTGTQLAQTITDRNGHYELLGLEPGNYQVQVNKSGYVFSPHERIYTSLQGVRLAEDYIGTTIVAGKGEVKVQGGKNGYCSPQKGEKVFFILYPQSAGEIHVAVYDLTGNLIWETTREIAANSQDIIAWDGRNMNNELVASGIYLARFNGGGIKVIKKVAIIK
ncbi:MAG: carboxypeptidase regulatory-like domain-containing protein, partial [bacterium]|nr:carboxypeptidase regulatory-like domain-containing protein [bacterium]